MSYRRGADFERKVRSMLESKGYLVIRSAGSKTPVDLVALKKGETPVLIQCKISGRITDIEVRELKIEAEKAGAKPALAYKAENGKIQIKEL